MTTNTPNRGWPVPEADDELLDGADAIAALGFQIDQDWPSASGTILVGQAGGFDDVQVGWWRYGRLVFVLGKVTRTGGAIAVEPNSGGTSGINAATLAALPAPVATQGLGGTNRALSRPCCWTITTGKVLQLVGALRGGDIATGTDLGVMGSYLTADL